MIFWLGAITSAALVLAAGGWLARWLWEWTLP